MDTNDKLLSLLKKQGYSITKPRIATFNAVLNADEALTTPQIVQLLPEIDTVSVYRSIQLFEQVGIFHRVWNGFKSKIELSDAFSPHHHHFVCNKCGSTQTINDKNLELSLHALEALYGFELRQHSVELSGYCNKCKNKNL